MVSMVKTLTLPWGAVFLTALLNLIPGDDGRHVDLTYNLYQEGHSLLPAPFYFSVASLINASHLPCWCYG